MDSLKYTIYTTHTVDSVQFVCYVQLTVRIVVVQWTEYSLHCMYSGQRTVCILFTVDSSYSCCSADSVEFTTVCTVDSVQFVFYLQLTVRIVGVQWTEYSLHCTYSSQFREPLKAVTLP